MSWGELLELRDDGLGNATLMKENVLLAYAFRVGVQSPLGGLTNPLLAMTGSANSYIQSYIYNSFNGVSSSADFVAYPSNGTDSHGWADMGITSLAYADPVYTCTGPNEAYLFGSGPSGTTGTGNLVIATDNTGTANAVQVYTNGFTQVKSAYRWMVDKLGNVLTKLNTAAPTLTVNGDMAMALTSNSTLQIYVRGTDGVTRGATIALV